MPVDPSQFVHQETRKIQAFAAMLCPSPAIPCVDAGWPKSTLQQWCYWRGLRHTGTKAALVARLADSIENGTESSDLATINLNRRAYVFNLVLESVRGSIHSYGDDGMGDKPDGMCRVEYWISHIDPDWVARHLDSPDWVAHPQRRLSHSIWFVRRTAAITIQSVVRRRLAAAIDAPPQDLHDGHVFHDPDNEDDPYPFCPVCSSFQWSDGCNFTLAEYIGLDRSGHHGGEVHEYARRIQSAVRRRRRRRLVAVVALEAHQPVPAPM